VIDVRVASDEDDVDLVPTAGMASAAVIGSGCTCPLCGRTGSVVSISPRRGPSRIGSKLVISSMVGKPSFYRVVVSRNGKRSLWANFHLLELSGAG